MIPIDEAHAIMLLMTIAGGIGGFALGWYYGWFRLYDKLSNEEIVRLARKELSR